MRCASLSSAVAPAACISRPWPSNWTPGTTSPSGSATPPTTRSASGWCSRTRPSAASSTPTGRSLAQCSASSPAGTTSTCTSGNHVHVGGHGFAAMSRKRPPAILQARCASLGVRVLFRAEAPDVAALARIMTWWWRPTGRTRPPGAASLRRSPRTWSGGGAVHLARHGPGFDAFKFYILDTPAGIMQVHGYPYSERASTFILEMHEDVWRRAGFGSVAAEGLASGQSDEASIGIIRGRCADVLGGPSVGQPSGGQHNRVRQQLAVDHVHHRAVPDLAARERGAARRRGAHRALLHRLRHQAGHGGRAGPGGLPARAAFGRGRLGGL